MFVKHLALMLFQGLKLSIIETFPFELDLLIYQPLSGLHSMDKAPPSLEDIELICHGLSTFDFNLIANKDILSNEKNKALALNYNGGGMAANAAIAAPKLGVKTAFSGFVSTDLFGELQFREMEREQVNVELLQRGNTPSPVCIIMAQADGNTSSFYNYQNIPDAPAPLTSGLKPNIILFDGHQAKTADMWVRHAKATGATTVLDAGHCDQGILRLARQVDIVISSQKFAEDYVGSKEPAIITKQISTLCNKFIVTRDRQGLLWNWKGSTGKMEAWPVKCVDGIGAGDAFHASFCAGLLNNLFFMDNLLRSSAAGALCCSGLGSRESLPDLKTLETFMKENTSPAIMA